MSVIRVYLKPFNENDEYVADFIDVTDDVEFNTLGSINRKVENDEYDVGVFKFDQLRLTLRNNDGKYSDAGLPDSIFKIRRNKTQVKITWDIQPFPLLCGVVEAGECQILDEEVILFEGFLSDVSFTTDIQDQKATFSVLGFESIFQEVDFPFASAMNGDTIEELLKLALNQTTITEVLTYNDANINVDLDIAVDNIERLENKTVKEVLDLLLLISNSVLIIEDRTIYVRSLDENPTPNPAYEFYGQASVTGAENIMSIEDIRTGVNRTFNYWTWRDTDLVARETSSIDMHGIRKKEVDFEGITNNTNRQAILDNLRDEWGNSRQEFTLRTPMRYDNLTLKFFDQISIDYPPIFFEFDNNPLAIYDLAIYDQSFYPLTQWALVIDPAERFKIMGISMNLKDFTTEYQLRKV